MCEKSGKEDERLAHLSQDLLVKLKSKMETHRQWKQEQVSREELKDLAQLCREIVRKAKAQLELTLVRNAENYRKSFYRYVSQKKKVKDTVRC